MKYLISLWLIITTTMLGAGPAHAIFVTDVYSDANIITRQEVLITIPESIPAYGIREDYNETKLVPYPSHDGYGIVNQQGNFFDEVVNLQANTGWWTLVFRVTNTSPYVWSDYHFEFWTPDFTTRLPSFPLQRFPGDAGHFPEGPWRNNIFLNSAFDGSILSFWAPDWQSPGQINNFDLTMNLDTVRGLYGFNSIGIRQVATTTAPEPGSMALLSIGLSVFLLTRCRRIGTVPASKRNQ